MRRDVQHYYHSLSPLAFAVLITSPCNSSAQVVRSLTSPPATTVTLESYHRDLIPRWSNGVLLAIGDDANENSHSGRGTYRPKPVVEIYGSDGAVKKIEIKIPGVDWAVVHDADYQPIGKSLLVCGNAANLSGQTAGYFAMVDESGSTRVIRTDPFYPTAVRIAPDGTIWAKGAEYDVVTGYPLRTTDHGVIRHFDQFGRFLAWYIPQSSLSLPEFLGGGDRLAVSDDRVGWYKSHGSKSYYEITGNRVSKFDKVPQADSIVSLSMVSGGTVFATATKTGIGLTLWTLDRNANQWFEIQLPRGTSALVLGSENDRIVLGRPAQKRLVAQMYVFQ